MTLPPY
jgi:hypothetical protein